MKNRHLIKLARSVANDEYINIGEVIVFVNLEDQLVIVMAMEDGGVYRAMTHAYNFEGKSVLTAKRMLRALVRGTQVGASLWGLI